MKSKAVAALLRGATRGDVEAMLRLSAMHLYGQGVDRDPAEALRWAREAAEAGSLEGAYMAATLLPLYFVVRSTFQFTDGENCPVYVPESSVR